MIVDEAEGTCRLSTLTGMAVHVAARIQGVAGPGDILVSSTVKDIVVGSTRASRIAGSTR